MNPNLNDLRFLANGIGQIIIDEGIDIIQDDLSLEQVKHEVAMMEQGKQNPQNLIPIFERIIKVLRLDREDAYRANCKNGKQCIQLLEINEVQDSLTEIWKRNILNGANN